MWNIKTVTERYDRLDYPPYQWFRADGPLPWQPLPKLLSDCWLGRGSRRQARSLPLFEDGPPVPPTGLFFLRV